MTTYYVSTRGNNGNDGKSLSNAWASIQYAAGRVGPGDTVKVEAGTYTELIDIVGVSGTASAPITFEALDLTSKPRLKYSTTGPKVTLEDCSYLRWRGFLIQDFTGKGMVVIAKTKSIRDVIVDQCDFIDCWASDSPGHMIKVETYRATYTAEQIHCTGNYFYNCAPTRPKDPTTGRLVGNEVMTFIGNVRYSSMRDNTLDSCWNIGLNLIGFDKTAANVYKGQPAYIIIRGNLIIDTYNTTGGASIYHDRALGPTLIENNTVESTSVVNGVFIGGEEGGYSGNNLDKENWESHIIVRNNTFKMQYMCARLGLVEFPQYPAHDLVFVHNTVITTSASNYRHSPLALEAVLALRVKNNVLEHRNNTNAVVVRSDAPDSYGDPSGMAASWQIDGNLWYSVQGEAAMVYEWPGHSDYVGRSAWKAGTGQGANGVYGQPVYEDEANRDFRLKSTSPGNGAAIPLTYANGAGSSSTTLVVDDSRYFSDGMYIIGGDTINVGGSEATVVAVDWATHTLTLDTAISWSDNDPVHYVYSGTAPSMGLTDTVGTGTPITPPTDPGTPGDPSDPPPPPSGGVDLLTNSEFDTNAWGGSLQWNKYTAGTATFAISGGQCVVNVTSTGGNTQLYQPGFEIVSGEDYEVEIIAQSASSSHIIPVKVIQHNSPYANLGLDTSITVTSTQQTFTLSFTATASESNSRLQLMFPITGEDVTFESIYLRRITYSSGGGSGATGTMTKDVAASGDDGYWTEGGAGFNATAWQLRVGDDSGTMRTTFLRFAVDDIPDGSTITAAYLDLLCERVDGTSGWEHQIAFENTVNASQPTGSTDLNVRTFLSATTWTPASPVAGTRYATADFSSQIQSLLDGNGGFSSSTLLVKLSDTSASGTGRLLGYESWDGANNESDLTQVAKLTIEWTEPGGLINPERTFSRTFVQTFHSGFSG